MKYAPLRTYRNTHKRVIHTAHCQLTAYTALFIYEKCFNLNTWIIMRIIHINIVLK